MSERLLSAPVVELRADTCANNFVGIAIVVLFIFRVHGGIVVLTPSEEAAYQIIGTPYTVARSWPWQEMVKTDLGVVSEKPRVVNA